ncbi:methyl transferase [Purpureocillium lavendulum]|uniref:Methyl transferase n=1 Tax=Purpureocillium lavendulum TaxID=1247861 RepID=A0AB34FCG3_9HYPO|nr:methyl transferase [Purpureocillium lavendulum]
MTNLPAFQGFGSSSSEEERVQRALYLYDMADTRLVLEEFCTRLLQEVLAPWELQQVVAIQWYLGRARSYLRSLGEDVNNLPHFSCHDLESMHQFLCNPGHRGPPVPISQVVPEAVIALRSQEAVLGRVLDIAVHINKQKYWPPSHADHVSFSRDDEPSFRSWRKLEENNAEIQDSINFLRGFSHPELPTQGDEFCLWGFVFWDEDRWERLSPIGCRLQGQGIVWGWPDMDTLIAETLIFESLLSTIPGAGFQAAELAVGLGN